MKVVESDLSTRNCATQSAPYHTLTSAAKSRLHAACGTGHGGDLFSDANNLSVHLLDAIRHAVVHILQLLSVGPRDDVQSQTPLDQGKQNWGFQ